ncbi:MAG: MlaD family protein [Desulfobacterales bacterium]|nr:MlaD family protein [Desulfobacterales bacterium]
MPKQSEKRGVEIKTGIFIVAVPALLVFSILWLRYFALRPEMVVIARFKDPGPVAAGMPVYYQGVNIGEVSRVEFSRDFRYTLIHLAIYQQNLRVPENTIAIVRQEGITGQKYISLNYPSSPSPELLSDGNVIRGETPFGIEDLQAFFQRQVESGRLDRIITNLEMTSANASLTTRRLDDMSREVNSLLMANRDEINNFFNQGSVAASNISDLSQDLSNFVGETEIQGNLRATVASISEASESVNQLFGNRTLQNNITQTTGNVSAITENVNEILSDQEIQQGLRGIFGGTSRLLGQAEQALQGVDISGEMPSLGNTVISLNNALNSVTSFVNNLNCYSGDIYSDVKQSQLIPNASEAFSGAASTFSQAENVLEQTGEVINQAGKSQLGLDTAGLITKTIVNANQTLQNTNRAAKRVDCLSEGVSEMLSKKVFIIAINLWKTGSNS